ncbi:MAG: glycosyltransferase family 4 protein [Alphaproteobacteria bacterium]
MNILLDAPWLDRSGAPLALLRLARDLARRHRVAIVPAPSGEQTLVPDFRAAGVRILDRTAVPGDHDVLLAATVFRLQLVAMAAERMATVVWVQEPALGRRIVVENPDAARALRRATRVVFVSDHQARDIYAGLVAPGRWEVVPIGIDVPAAPPARPPRRSGRLDLVQVATIEPRKGQHVALQALDRLDDPNLRLALVGAERPGPAAIGIRAMLAARPALGDRVEIVGPLAPDAVLGRWAAADAALFPTLDDNLPTALLEAMAAGCPVVASALPAIAEAIEDGVTGLLVPPGDPLALAAAIARVRDDPALAARLSAAGRVMVARRFTLHDHVAAMEMALQRAVDEGPRR